MNPLSSSRRHLIRAGALGSLGLAAMAAIPPRFAAAAPARPSGLAADPTRDVAGWEVLYQAAHDALHATTTTRSLSGDSYWIYYVAYAIDGALAMARATGDTAYLDIALTYAENLVSTAQVANATNFPASKYQDGYLGWISSHSATLGEQVSLYEAYAWRYITLMLRVIHDTPAWYGNTTIRNRYDTLLAFTQANIYSKWAARPPGGGLPVELYRSRTHMTSHWGLISQHLAEITTSSAQRTSCLAVLANIDGGPMPYWGSCLRDQLIAHPANSAAYFFSDVWGNFSAPGSDTSHANAVVAYVVEAQAHGTFWTTTDLTKFATTLDQVIWTSSTQFADYLDGTGNSYWFMSDGWIKLGRHDAALQARFEAHTPPSGSTQYAYRDQYYGNGALNAALLGL